MNNVVVRGMPPLVTFLHRYSYSLDREMTKSNLSQCLLSLYMIAVSKERGVSVSINTYDTLAELATYYSEAVQGGSVVDM